MPPKFLNRAKNDKQDEFYTQLSDIEKELKHYKDFFKDKIVFCNCDDPETSNFWKFFELNFEHLGFKKLVATHFEIDKPSYKLELMTDITGDGRIDKSDVVRTPLKQNGDFRSPECIEILKEADVVITNPPFSLFREYLSQLTEYNKKFLIVGNPNAITYKEIFKLIKDDKIWLGYKSMGTDMLFDVPKKYMEELVSTKKEGSGYKIINGIIKGRTQAVWFTNIETKKRYEDLVLYKKYYGNESKYPKYNNYNAINIDKIQDIPCDYFGEMGVPITFMSKYNPKQFEIIGAGNNGDNFIPDKTYLNPYKIMKNGEKGNGSFINFVLAIEVNEKPDKTYYISDNSGYLITPYVRIIIKRKGI